VHDEEIDEAALIARAAELERPGPPDDGLADRILAAWTGRAIGNTMGKPVEGLPRVEVERYLRAAGQWPLRGYIRLLDPLPEGVSGLHPSAVEAALGTFIDVPRDDDLDWAILALHTLERHGADVTTEQFAEQWLDRIPYTQTYTAERVAYANLVRGLRPPETATVDNPYREWVGALIRADVLGYVHPGRPAEAVRLALVDARLSHTGVGVLGEVWAAALISLALAADTATEAFDAALSILPAASRLTAALAGLQELRASGASATAALDRIDAELGHYDWVHTIPSAAAIAVGLLWGDDFADAVGLTIAAGRDTDSSAATTGSVFGALHGMAGIPVDLVGTTHVRIRSSIRDFDRVEIADLARRTLAVADALRS
jgi:ADP-ribosylglycohydrolase